MIDNSPRGFEPERPQFRARVRKALALGTAGVLAAAGVLSLAGSANAASTLGASAAAKGRYFGAAVAANHLGEAQYASTLDTEFNAVTPENEMKWDAVEGTRNSFNYSSADQIVSHAQGKGMKVRGHTLVWYSQLPGWVGGLAAADLRTAMNNHITQVMTHYKGKIYAWDVVNEAFQDGSSGARRSSRSRTSSATATSRRPSVPLASPTRVPSSATTTTTPTVRTRRATRSTTW